MLCLFNSPLCADRQSATKVGDRSSGGNSFNMAISSLVPSVPQECGGRSETVTTNQIPSVISS